MAKHKATNKGAKHAYTGKHHKVSGLPTNHHPHRTALVHPQMPPQANMGGQQMGTPGQAMPGMNPQEEMNNG